MSALFITLSNVC